MQSEDFLPRIHSMIRSIEGPEEERAVVPPLVLLSMAQLEESLEDVEITETPLTAGPALGFFPYNGFALGVPFCLPRDSELTCYAVSGGPDDDPFGWTCVCEGPREDKRPRPLELGTGDKTPPMLLACRLEVVQLDRPLTHPDLAEGDNAIRYRCANLNCQAKGGCVVVRSGKFLPLTIACRCGGL